MAAIAFRVPRSRSTAASEPGPTTVLVRTVLSYCSYTHRLDAMEGESRSRRSVQVGSASSGFGSSEERSRPRSAAISADSTPWRV